MAHYQGRRGPNVSQYLAHLNSDVPQQQPAQDFFEDDIALFTNTDFFDFDLNSGVADLAGDLSYANARRQHQGSSPAAMNRKCDSFATHGSILT